MRLKIIALTLAIAGVVAVIYNNHQRSAEATAAVHSTKVAVDTLYRNSAHTLPAVDLTEKKDFSSQSVDAQNQNRIPFRHSKNTTPKSHC